MTDSPVIYPTFIHLSVDKLCVCCVPTGLDPSSYHQRSDLGERGEEGEISLSTQTSEGERFRDCSAFRFVCPTDDCRTECVVYGVFIARPMNGADGKVCEQKLFSCSCVSVVYYYY